MCIICLAPVCEFEDPASSAAAGGTTADSFQTVTVSIPDPSDAYGIETGEIWEDPVLTYGFPDSADAYIGVFTYYGEQNGYLPLSAGGQEMVSYAMAQWDAVSGISLTLATDENTADIRVAGSTYPSTAWAYSPDNAGTAAGDVWIGVDQSYNALFTRDDEPYVGSYEYYVSLHEIGHSLGLKHPHEAKTTNSTTVSSEYDAIEYTVMSYRSYVGSSTNYLTPADGHYPQSLMMLDIAAIQSIYGADYTTLSGDTVYTFNPLTGEMLVDGVSTPETVANVVFRTLWDGDGNDTIDLSAYTTDMYVDLTPGSYIILDTNGAQQRAQLGSNSNGAIYAQANIYMSLLADGDTRSLIENATGGDGDDILQGNVADNVLIAGAGDDMISGDLGADTLTGGAGADLFIDGLAELDGDTITDFDTTEDRLVISGALAAEITFSYDETTDALTVISSGGQQAVITLPLSDAATLPVSVVDTTDGVEIVFSNSTAGDDTSDDTIPAVVDDPVTLQGGYADNHLIGGTGNDNIMVRWGDDVVTAGAGADKIIIDWRYVEGGETFYFTDLNFGESDDLIVRYYNGDQAFKMYNDQDLADFMLLDSVTQTSTGFQMVDDSGKQITVVFGSPDTATEDPVVVTDDPVTLQGGYADNHLIGGTGNDNIMVRWGDDTVTAGAGADKIIIDWRYVEGGETFTFTDLNFDESDDLIVRYYNGDQAFKMYNAADLTAFYAQDFVTQTSTGFQMVDDSGKQITVVLGEAVDTSLPDDPIYLQGSGSDDLLVGGNGSDTIMVRWGDDTATGNGGADQLIVDWRYVRGGETFTFTDLNFDEGDDLIIRYINGNNAYKMYNTSDLASFLEQDNVTATSNGFQISDNDGLTVNVVFGDTVNTGLSTEPIYIQGSGSADVMIGGNGNDTLMMRWNDDTATGNGGADQFILDWRYIKGGETFTVTDLDFAERDKLKIRYFNGDTAYTVSDADDLLRLIDTWDEVVQTETGLEITNSDGAVLALELDLATLLAA